MQSEPQGKEGGRVAWMAHTGPCALSSSELYLEDLHPSAMSGCSKTFQGLSRTMVWVRHYSGTLATEVGGGWMNLLTQ